MQHVSVVVPRLEELLLSLLESQHSMPPAAAEAEDGSASGGSQAGSPTQANGGASGPGAGGGDSIPRWAALLLRLTTKLNRQVAEFGVDQLGP